MTRIRTPWHAAVTAAALDRLQGNTTAQAVYVRLMLYANHKDGVAWPHQDTLAVEVGVSAPTVRRALGDIEAAGLLIRRPRIVKGRKVGNEYEVVMVPEPERASARDPEDEPERAPARATERASARDCHARERLLEGTDPKEQTQTIAPAGAERAELALVEPPLLRAETTPAVRERDVVWDAVMHACGVDQDAIPKGARGAYNRAVKELKEVDATAADIMARAQVFRIRWPDASLTPTALCRRWAECGAAAGAARPLTDAQAAVMRLQQLEGRR